MTHETPDRVDRFEIVPVTPEAFERQVASIFASLGANVQDLKVVHHERLMGTDGEFVADATARFEALGVSFLVLIEAKLHGRPVERADVQILRQKMLSTGAQKGIVASNAGFQRGAIDFARVHGIALIRIVDGAALIETRRAESVGRRPFSGRLGAVQIRGAEPDRVEQTVLTEQPAYVAEMLGLRRADEDLRLRLAEIDREEERARQALREKRVAGLTAPGELRESIRELTAPQLVRTCAQFRLRALTDPSSAMEAALRTLARRHRALTDEIRVLDRELDRLTREAGPRLHAIYGAGTDTVGALLVAAGDNPERLRSESSFSMLCGVSPLAASSGKTKRHRLNRGGDRKANQALWRIVMLRLRHGHPPTVDYVARRTAEGKSKGEIIRCLKRYVAREVYAALTEDHPRADARGAGSRTV